MFFGFFRANYRLARSIERQGRRSGGWDSGSVSLKDEGVLWGLAALFLVLGYVMNTVTSEPWHTVIVILGGVLALGCFVWLIFVVGGRARRR